MKRCSASRHWGKMQITSRGVRVQVAGKAADWPCSRNTRGNAQGRAAAEGGLVLSYKTKHILTICPCRGVLGNYPKNLRTCTSPKACTWGVRALMDMECGNRTSIGRNSRARLWCNQMMQLYWVLKRNELPSHERPLRKNTFEFLSESSQLERALMGMMPAI